MKRTRMRRAYLKPWTGKPVNTGRTRRRPAPSPIGIAVNEMYRAHTLSFQPDYDEWLLKKEQRIDRLLGKLFPEAFVNHLKPKPQKPAEDHVDHKILNWMKIRELQDMNQHPTVDNMVVLAQSKSGITTLWWASGARKFAFIRVREGLAYLSHEYPTRDYAMYAYTHDMIRWEIIEQIT